MLSFGHMMKYVTILFKSASENCLSFNSGLQLWTLNQTYHKRYLLGVEIALMQLYIMAMVVILLAFKTNQMRNSHAYHSNVSF